MKENDRSKHMTFVMQSDMHHNNYNYCDYDVIPWSFILCVVASSHHCLYIAATCLISGASSFFSGRCLLFCFIYIL